jgi:hypothetical protein
MTSTRPCIACRIRPSIEKSHIVPRSMYKAVRGNDKNMLVLDTEMEVAGKPLQNGHWEPLLCSVCEGDFSARFDSPAYQFVNGLPTRLPLISGRLPASIPIEFPKQYRQFVISVLYRSTYSVDTSWNQCATCWDGKALLDILNGRSLDKIEVYPRLLAFGNDGSVEQGFVVPPQRLMIPGDTEPYSCMAFGGMEYISRMHRGKLSPSTPQIPLAGGTVTIPVGDIRQSWALHDVRAKNRPDEPSSL